MLVEFNGKKPKVHPEAFVAPNATLIGDVEVGPQSSIWFGAVLRADWNRIRIGARTSVQDNCVMHGSMLMGIDVGDNCTVGHGAVVHNGTVRDGALVGMNAVVLDGAEVGEQAVVSAGSVVTSRTKVPPRTLVAGVPAEVKKELSQDALNNLGMAKGMYVDLARQYVEEGNLCGE